MVLHQAKKRTTKISITDVAIKKVPYIEYRGFTDEQNIFMRDLAKNVLAEAKNYNDSNEVAITFDMDVYAETKQYALTYGTEVDVDICADVLAYHYLMSSKRVSVVVLHNHPTTKTFSLDDIRFFLEYPSLRLMVVVSNQGTIHYILKDRNYIFKDAAKLYSESVSELTRNSSLQEAYVASLTFLSRCSEAGLFYN